MRNLCIANFPTLTCLPHKRKSLMQNSQLEKSREICGEYNCAILITTQFLILIFQIDLQIFRTYRLTILSFFFPSFLSFSSSPFFFFFFLRITNDQLTLVLQNHECRIKCHELYFFFLLFLLLFFSISLEIRNR